MASRVNVKFVIALSTVLGIVFIGVATMAVMVVLKSADDLARFGDRKMAEQDYRAAEEFYSKAVNKDPTRVELLLKWRSAIELKIPASETEYRDDYTNFSKGILYHLSRLEREGTDAHREFLDQSLKELQFSPFSRVGWESLAESTTDILERFEDGSATGENWEALKRYRGIALVQLVRAASDLEQYKIDMARDDLVAAIKADPTDGQAASTLSEWHFLRASVAQEQGDDDQAKLLIQQAEQIIDQLLEDSPRDTYGIVKKFHITIDKAYRSIDPSLTGARATMAFRAAFDPLGIEIDRTATQLAGADLTTLDRNFLGNFLGASSAIDANRAAEQTGKLLDAAIAASPTNAALLLLKAELLLRADDPQGATDIADQTIKLPFPPICLDGLLLFEHKKQAIVHQANASLMMWQTEEDVAIRATHLDKAKAYRQDLSKQLPEGTPILLLLDAKLEIADGDLTTARRFLEDFNTQTNNQNVEGLRLLGRIALQLSQPGLAQEQFTMLVESRPGDLSALLVLAEIEAKLKNTQVAIDLYTRALALDPANEIATEQMQLLEALSGRGTVADPVLQALITAKRLRDGNESELPNPAGADAHLLQALRQFDNDQRIISSLVTTFLQDGKVTEALAVVAAGVESHPDNEGLKTLRTALESGDLLTVELTGVDNSPTDPLDKELARFRIYSRHKDKARAAQALDAAAKLDPLDARVVEALFIRALNASDRVEAQRLTDLAAEHNLDNAHGLTFQARIELHEGNKPKAAATLTQAIEQGVTNAETFRLIARVQNEIGRSSDALASLQSALRLNPNNITILNEYIQTLIRLDRLDDALNTARASIQIGQSSDSFLNLWLNLEAVVGNRQEALSRREQIAQRDPENRENGLALARLYIDLQRWQNATQLLDTLAGSGESSLNVVLLRARLSADQGDLEGAGQVFMDHILNLKMSDEQPSAVPYITFGKFMLDRGDVKTGMTALEQGREYQDPATMHADRALGEVYYTLGRYEDAADVYQRILAADIDDSNHSIRKRALDPLIRLKRFDEATALIAGAGQAAQTDLQFILFQADIARYSGDERQAATLLDKAISLFPNDATTYLKRADLVRHDSRMAQDALADINRALQLRPNNWQALRLRALIHFGLGQIDEALDDLTAAVRANMSNKELWVSLIGELLRYDKPSQAVTIADEAITRFPNDLDRLLAAGDAFAKAAIWNRASIYYEQCFRLSKSTLVTGRYVDSLLLLEPPNHRKALAIITDSGLDISDSPPLLTLRARIWAAAGNTKNARADATAALIPLKGSPSSIEGWSRQLSQVFPDVDDLIAYVDELDQNLGDGNWTVFFRAQARLQSKSEASEGLSLITDLTTTTDDFDLLTLISRTCYAGGHYAQSAAALKRSLEMQPDNIGLNNNLAFTLAQHLDKAAEALPFALKAVELAPGQARMLDTLGLVQHRAGEFDNAEQTFLAGLSAAKTTAEKVALNVHFAQLKFQRGDNAAARRYAKDAQDGLSLIPTGLTDYRNDLKELMESLN